MLTLIDHVLEADAIVVNGSFAESQFTEGKEVLYADVHVDRKGRFIQGAPIRTSTIESKTEYHGYTMVETLNSTYLLVTE